MTSKYTSSWWAWGRVRPLGGPGCSSVHAVFASIPFRPCQRAVTSLLPPQACREPLPPFPQHGSPAVKLHLTEGEGTAEEAAVCVGTEAAMRRDRHLPDPRAALRGLAETPVHGASEVPGAILLGRCPPTRSAVGQPQGAAPALGKDASHSPAQHPLCGPALWFQALDH